MAITPKTNAAAPVQPINYQGQNLASPTPQAYPQMKAGNIQSYIDAFQTGQNQSNNANNQRYNQGLGVLSGGAQNAQGYLSQALANTDKLGAGERQAIAQQQQSQLGSVNQGAISRGLGNTTVTDALQQGVNRTANLANINLDESLARQHAGVNMAQAGQENQSSNSIAGFIGARNDTGPNASLLSNLVTGAASNPGNKIRSADTTGGPGNGPKAPPVSTPSSSGGALGSGTYFSNAGSGGGGSGAGSIGSYLGNQGGGQTAPSQAGGDALGGHAFFGNGGSVGPASPGANSNPLTMTQDANGKSVISNQSAAPSTATQAAAPRQISQADASYYSQLWGPNWKNALGGNVQVV